MTVEELPRGTLVRVGKSGAKCWTVLEIRHGWLTDPGVVLICNGRTRYVRLSDVREIVNKTEESG